MGVPETVFNRMVTGVTRMGVSLWGTRVLTVRGRRTGEPRSVPVNVLEHAGERYLVAPRGQTQWVRNLRAAREGTLRLGRSREPFAATELADTDKTAVLRAYLRRWGWEVGAFFGDVGPDASEARLREVASSYPVFLLERVGRSH